jgi:hypothetical protein
MDEAMTRLKFFMIFSFFVLTSLSSNSSEGFEEKEIDVRAR